MRVYVVVNLANGSGGDQWVNQVKWLMPWIPLTEGLQE